MAGRPLLAVAAGRRRLGRLTGGGRWALAVTLLVVACRVVALVLLTVTGTSTAAATTTSASVATLLVVAVAVPLLATVAVPLMK